MHKLHDLLYMFIAKRARLLSTKLENHTECSR